MVARIGIELSAAACRIVELDAGAVWSREHSETRIISFASLPLGDPELTKRLASLRGRHATVVVWTPHDYHRQVVVAFGPYDRMRTEARVAFGAVAAETPLLCDIAPAAPHLPGADRRTVMVEAVPRVEVISALRLVEDAGIKVDRVLTPAAALASLARLRRDLSVPSALEAYIALEETESTIALVSRGLLLAARTAAWGYLGDPAAHGAVRDREDIAVRLASDLSVCLTSARFGAMPLSQVCMCGGLPELRSMTVSLMERLDVEVEPLDALFGIDATRLPEPADVFREYASAFRLAWAAAADRRPILDLLRPQKLQARRANFSRAAVAAGIVVGLGGGWALQQRWHPWESPRRAPRRIAADSPAPAIEPQTLASSQPDREVVVSTPEPSHVPDRAAPPTPQAAQSAAPPPTALPVVLPAAPPVVEPRVDRGLAPLATSPRETPAPTRAAPRISPPAIEPPVRRSVEPIAPSRMEKPATVPSPVGRPGIEPPARPGVEPGPPGRRGLLGPTPVSPPVARPVLEPPARRSVEPAPSRSGRQASAPVQTDSPANATAPPARLPAVPSVEPLPLPFEAVLETILYGPERKLAIVDGRIVQAGDDVRGARIVEITPTAVFLRDAQGRLRRLTAGASGR